MGVLRAADDVERDRLVCIAPEAPDAYSKRRRPVDRPSSARAWRARPTSELKCRRAIGGIWSTSSTIPADFAITGSRYGFGLGTDDLPRIVAKLQMKRP